MRLVRWIVSRSLSLAAVSAILSLGSGCDAPEEPDETAAPNDRPAPASPEGRTKRGSQALLGQDGNLTVSAANTVVNQYAVLAANAAAGATSISVTNIADLNSAAFGPLGAGDLIMIIQMQGAAIDTSNTAQYGVVTNLASAGRYEIVGVTGTQGNTINLDTSCNGLEFAYSAAGNVQVVRVPQVQSLTVQTGASITAPAWDGARGGVVAVHSTGTAALQGPIDVSGRGFRGGVVDNQSASPGANTTLFRSADANDGGEKGEGIAGFQASYTNGRYGRGAPANAGGGGNSHNAGGGGGANARNMLNSPWTGQGVMSAAVVGAGAWALDPGFIANGGLTTSSGGGRGGYTYSANDSNALVSAPGSAVWGGDNRREVGGLGGRPLDVDPTGRIFFGGGGGAGDGNNNAGASGGAGGGIVVLFASSLSGTGAAAAIRANGAPGQGTSGGGNDAPGGGGGGGTILISASSITTVAFEARGGVGGSQTIAGNEAEGPGGGGGGGYVLAVSAVPPAVSTLGGAGGTSNSAAVTEFPTNGATAGNSGMVPTMSATLSACLDTTAPDTTIATFEPNPTNDPTGDFTFTSNDATATFECSVDGGAFAPCPATFSTASLANGSHTIQVRAKDLIGNVDPTPAMYTWVVDTVAPDTTIATFEPDPTNDPTGDFTFASNDATATFECSVDGGAFAPCPATFSTAALADGSHTLQVRAVDAAGNVDPTPASYTWVVDTTAPDTTIATFEPSPTNDPTGDFTFTSNDATATFECSIDGGAFTPCPATFSTAALADGPHTLEVAAVDAAGNTDPTPATYTWIVDTDSDDDGLTDADEAAIGTDPNDADSDDDGVIDSQEPSPGTDTDGDGLVNALDPDSDDDGLFDGTELGFDCGHPATNPAAQNCIADADSGTTTTDPLDPDTDDGGVADGAEDANLNGAVDPGETNPTAGNGADDTDVVNADADGDGLTDAVETFIGTDPNDADSDDDGALDGAESNPADDTDGDGLINALDADSDNDGLFDGLELGLDCSHPDTDVTANVCTADADGGATVTSPLDADTDGGGVNDGSEDINKNGQFDPGEINPTAGNGADDATALDSDGDGLTDAVETLLGTDPNDADSDDDGALDGSEANYNEDTDGDGVLNALDPDSDDDGLFDGTELGFDCGNPATDPLAMTCIADADPATKTSPLLFDTDGGGVSDGDEDTNKNGALDAGERDPTAGHGADDLQGDSDGDGLTDGEELVIGTDPFDADSDDDGLPDGQEIFPSGDADGDGLINALDADSDDDGLFDGTEAGLDCDGPGTDVAAGNCIPDADGGATTTDPNVADTDNGGVGDGVEDANHDGAVDPGETDPNDPSDDVIDPDTDGDGLSDAMETTIGTDPNDADSDADGVIDGQEPNPTGDADGDGTINALDPDSDGDGLKDGTELGFDCSEPDTDPAAGNCVPDGDGGATTTDPLDPDSDDGGVSDGAEDVDKDGTVDPGETDPNNPADDVPTTGCTTDADCGDEQSGMVCDTVAGVCVEGCHDPGNGCPADEVCTSEDATIGECVECTIDAHCGDAQSGLVCDPTTNACIQGCRGEGGNDCPEDQTCSSTTDEIGQCDDGSSAEQVVAEGSGLFCAAAPARDDDARHWLLPLALGTLLGLRRRRR